MVFVRLILIGWYLVLTIGMSIHLHYCMGRLKTVELVLQASQSCRCQSETRKPKCCEDEFITLSVDEPHVGPQHLEIPSLLPTLGALLHPLQLRAEMEQAAQIAIPLELRGPPPPGIPRYLAFQAMVFYA